MKRWLVVSLALTLLFLAACACSKEQVEVAFSSDVDGATLWINGTEKGVLPLTVPLAVGTYQLEVRPAPGLEDVLHTWGAEYRITKDTEAIEALLLIGMQVTSLDDIRENFFQFWRGGLGGADAGPGQQVFWTRDGNLLYTRDNTLRWLARGFGESKTVEAGDIQWYWATGREAYCLIDGEYYLIDFDAGSKTRLSYAAMYGNRISKHVVGITEDNIIEVIMAGDVRQIAPESGQVEHALVDTQGSKLLYCTRDGAQYKVWLHDIASAESVPIAQLNNAPYGFEFALSGNYFSFFSAEGMWVRPADMAEYDNSPDWEGWLLTDEGIHRVKYAWEDIEMPRGGRQEELFIVGPDEEVTAGVMWVNFTSKNIRREDMGTDYKEMYVQDLFMHILVENIKGDNLLIRYRNYKQGEYYTDMDFLNVCEGDWAVSPCSNLLAYAELAPDGSTRVRIFNATMMQDFDRRLHN